MRCYSCDRVGHRSFECTFPKTRKAFAMAGETDGDGENPDENAEHAADDEPQICYAVLPDLNPTGNGLPWIKIQTLST